MSVSRVKSARFRMLDQVLAQLSPAGVGADRASTVATVLLLLPEFPLSTRLTVRNRVDHQEIALDGELLRQLYTTCPLNAKLQILDTLAFSRSDPETFGFLFRDAFQRKLKAEKQVSLLVSLQSFLDRHPDEVSKYRAVIVKVARAPRRGLAMLGLQLLGYLDDLTASELRLLERGMDSRVADDRMSALSALTALLGRYPRLGQAARAWCLSAERVGWVRHLSTVDPDPWVRRNARHARRAYRSLLSSMQSVR